MKPSRVLVAAATRIIVEFAPFPNITACVEIVAQIIDGCEQIKSNSNVASQLCEHCRELLVILRDNKKDTMSANMKASCDYIEKTLINISTRINKWSNKGFLVLLAKQGDIREDLDYCSSEIQRCLQHFAVASHLDIHRWQSEFEANQKRDREILIRYLSNPKNSIEITSNIQRETKDPSLSEISSQIAQQMQQALVGPESVGDIVNRGLQSNLYDLQIYSRQLLPDRNLRRGEVRRIGVSPTDGDGMVDVWEGLYLDREKVQIKVLRATRSSPKNLQRFQRAAQVWSEVLRVDGGKYILPFYGYNQNDGPFPYIVSRWPRFGTSIDYVKAYPDVDHRHLIRGIACGIHVLHSMNPPIVHGTIRGRCVYIGDMGEPLLGDFGVSKMIADITDVPFSQSQGVADAYRWLAPECWEGEGTLSIKSDIHSYAMTVLELMTHKYPYAEVKHTPQMLVIASAGKRPDRPTKSEVIERGLDDSLWKLIQRCWASDPSVRPTIQDVLSDLGATP